MARIRKNLEPSLAKMRARRAYLGLTQTELAEKARTSKQTVCEIENGSQRPNRSTLFALCDSLNFTYSDRAMLFRAFGHPPVSEFDPIGLHIRALRVRSGLTQGQMADRIGTTRAAVSKAEMGHSAVVNVAPLVYGFFGVPAAERLEHEIPAKTEPDGEEI